MCQSAGPGRCQLSQMKGQQERATLRVSYGRVSVLGGRIERFLRRDVVGRSMLLSDLVASCKEQVTNVPTPLEGEKFDAWIAYAGASNKANWSLLSQLCDEQLIKALEAADYLNDEQSTEQLSKQLAVAFTPAAGAINGKAYDHESELACSHTDEIDRARQLMDLLPGHLAMAVLRAVPPTPDTPHATRAFVLSHLLHILPPSMHSLAVQARFLSVTVNGALALPTLPVLPCMSGSTTAAALSAAAGAGGITQLTLESLREAPSAWAAELAALRMLRVLRLRANTLGGLSVAVPALPALRCLHLHGGCGDCAELAELLTQLSAHCSVAELTLEVKEVWTKVPKVGGERGGYQVTAGCMSPQAAWPELLRRPAVAGKHALSRAARALSSSQRVCRMQKAAQAVQAAAARAECAVPQHAYPALWSAEGGVPAALAALGSLTRLSIGSCGIQDAGHLTAAVGQLTGLQEVQLRRMCVIEGGDGAGFADLAAAIGGLRRLTALCLQSFHVTRKAASACVAQADGSTGSTSRSVRSEGGGGALQGWPALGPALCGLPQLHTLKLRHCNVCEAGVRALSPMLESAPALQALELCAAVLPLDSVVGVLGALGRRGGDRQPAVRWLRVGAIAAPALPYGVAEQRRLTAALAPLSALTHLALDSAGFARAEAAAVVAQLAWLPALAELHVVRCSVGDRELAALAQDFPALRRLANFRVGAAGRLAEGRWVEVWPRPGTAAPS
eukprot:jgi/Ulvmu1/10631/UM066_0010.1